MDGTAGVQGATKPRGACTRGELSDPAPAAHKTTALKPQAGGAVRLRRARSRSAAGPPRRRRLQRLLQGGPRQLPLGRPVRDRHRRQRTPGRVRLLVRLECLDGAYTLYDPWSLLGGTAVRSTLYAARWRAGEVLTPQSGLSRYSSVDRKKEGRALGLQTRGRRPDGG